MKYTLCPHSDFLAPGSMTRKIIRSWYYQRFMGR
jgi:hypothetical protein